MKNWKYIFFGYLYLKLYIKMQVMEDWKYMAMVLDRLFLWLFTLTCFAGSGGIILRAPRFGHLQHQHNQDHQDHRDHRDHQHD